MSYRIIIIIYTCVYILETTRGVDMHRSQVSAISKFLKSLQPIREPISIPAPHPETVAVQVNRATQWQFEDHYNVILS